MQGADLVGGLWARGMRCFCSVESVCSSLWGENVLETHVNNAQAAIKFIVTTTTRSTGCRTSVFQRRANKPCKRRVSGYAMKIFWKARVANGRASQDTIRACFQKTFTAHTPNAALSSQAEPDRHPCLVNPTRQDQSTTIKTLNISSEYAQAATESIANYLPKNLSAPGFQYAQYRQSPPAPRHQPSNIWAVKNQCPHPQGCR